MDKCILCLKKIEEEFQPLIISAVIFYYPELDDDWYKKLSEFHERYNACVILDRDR